MPDNFTAEDFTPQLQTKFRIRFGDERVVELELEEVTAFPPLTDSRGEVERFSLYFYGPSDTYLPQMIYHLEHERMGEMDIFLVPVGRDERGFRYEAVFSFFK
ncbi:MAG: hypothetical protein QOC99_1322 [Acidobacteriota bacterium]|jgi:L-ascorbate metabolism protein UlaG (beta-lactamase superfamily)|nr:hypothetical protein [Acidobacteriota bacterium]